jgi:uncharacterized protein (TIGR02246 family)
MLRLIVLSIGLMVSAAGVFPAKGAQVTADAAVRSVVKTYLDARERGDAAAIGALFTADADQLVSSGEWRKGREAIVKGTLGSSKQNAGTRVIAIESVRFPSADVAIADGRYEIVGTGTERRMWTSFVMVRIKDQWQIAAIRNMLPAN